MAISLTTCVWIPFSAIGLAISRDGSSGGVIRLGKLNEKGIARDLIKFSEISESIEGPQQEIV